MTPGRAMPVAQKRKLRRKIMKKDAKNGYLQGGAIERELVLRPPVGGFPGVPEEALLRALVPIYGTGEPADV